MFLSNEEIIVEVSVLGSDMGLNQYMCMCVCVYIYIYIDR